MASSSIKRRVITPPRSKRVPKDLCGQAMNNEDSSAAIRSKDIDNNTARGVTRKRNANDSSVKSRKKGTGAKRESFEGRCKHLIDFIDEFGHSHVPRKFPAYPTLGKWCSKMRCAYKKIQLGLTPKSTNLTPDQIERLEEIGFKWNFVSQGTTTFEQRLRDLEAFKSEFGHCHIPWTFPANPSLGHWCSVMRSSYKQIQQGQRPRRNLTQDQIQRLEEIGLKQDLAKQDYKTFEQRCRDLEAFKIKFGHCNVPFKYSDDPSLGRWCNLTRYTYNQKQGQTPKRALTEYQIERLEEIGFKWKLDNVQGLTLTLTIVGCEMTMLKRVFSDDPKLC